MDRTLAMLKATGEVDFEKAVAVITVNLGVAQRKASEYLGVLKAAGKISIKDGMVKVTRKGGG
jgi:hypothetical protein